jgi:hypothetical protein
MDGVREKVPDSIYLAMAHFFWTSNGISQSQQPKVTFSSQQKLLWLAENPISVHMK